MKIGHYIGSPFLFQYNELPLVENITLHKHCLLDIIHVEWDEERIHYKDRSIPLREHLNVPLKDKIRLRWILKKNYQIMYMVKQGDTWYNLTKLEEMKTNANLYIFYFSVPQQKEVAGVWYRDHEGKQFLKIALPADAWSMTATIKTRKGVHRMTMDRWGDSTDKMSAYNNRYHPSNRDQRQIDRMKRKTMVLYPTLQPNLVLPKRSPGFSGGPGVFPRGSGGLKRLNWRAEGLRVQPPMNQSQSEEEEPSTSGFYRQQREAAPFVTRRRFHRKSPSKRPHRRMPYPPSPQYRGNSTSEDEVVQVPAAKGKYTDPTPTPIPRDEHASMNQEESGEEGDSSGYVPRRNI